jgi:hypothetical protein
VARAACAAAAGAHGEVGGWGEGGEVEVFCLFAPHGCCALCRSPSKMRAAREGGAGMFVAYRKQGGRVSRIMIQVAVHGTELPFENSTYPNTKKGGAAGRLHGCHQQVVLDLKQRSRRHHADSCCSWK